ncbi:MAG: ATP-binding protein [Symploca sp. SIO3C6]|uniref:ATP-binding protein n=1 Tax=Symploca sp. SIO1C4 TaxID=2607765 RepID=A0A6B3NBP4_9CYAN|nr:ATP-binding protein [Symploca sp. SIO3C6]NER26598.1 ATP-binding protein [Symploca sp. SIO1C4]NET03177.1 ATP-binding protein [Symploca sp. SIO2B6]NET52282.1 ATP-binding protein [Merismopedia sp. SIO2A8]
MVDLKGFEQLKNLQKSLKQVSTDLKALDQLLLWFDQLNQPYIPKKVWLQCQLALAEGFTNAVRHAHKNFSSNAPIDVEVTICVNSLEMRIWDLGPPFDLEQWLENQNKNVDQEAGGGRGIAILHKIADKLSYTRTDDNRNCLLIVKGY